MSPAGSGPAAPGTLPGPGDPEIAPPPPRTPPVSEPADPGRRSARPWALIVAVGVFVLAITVVSELRYYALVGSTWDLGIYQQALWSAAHGGPFFESADYETGGFGSLLQVHSAFVLYLLAPAYGAWPDPLLLFAVQATAVGLGAFPLYYLALSRGATRSRSLGLAVLYLAWAPAIDAALYDFHIEAFVPVAYLTVTCLWSTRRYLLGSLAFVGAVATMEVLPVLLAFVGALLVAERLAPQWKQILRGGWSLPLRDREVIAGVALFVACLVAYYSLLEMRTELLSAWFGFPKFPTGAEGYVSGSSPAALQLSPSNLSVVFYQKVTYWVLLLGLVGFLPLLRPRGILLVLPWIAFTLLTPDPLITVVGYQYALVAAGPLFAAGAWALPFLPWPPRATAPAAGDPARPRRRWRRWARPGVVATGAVALVGLNLLLTPFGGVVGSTLPGVAYSIGQSFPPASAGAFALASLVPPGASVIASDLLFPLVANDPQAYSLIWMPDTNVRIPFNASHLPSYVLIAEGRLRVVPPWLTATIYNASDFGVRGVAWGSPVGTAVLFEAGYGGAPSTWGTAPSGTEMIPPSALSIPRSEAAISDDPTSPTGQSLVTLPEATGLLWDGPHSDLAPGSYTVTFWLRAFPTVPGAPPGPGTPVLSLVANEFAQSGWFTRTIAYSVIAGASFVPVSFSIEVTSPSISVAFPGYALTASAGVALGGIQVAPAG